jgi:hypothetical protein
MLDMKHFILFILILLPIFSCDLESQSYNGVYCADVHYYNPNTGTDSEYVLTVEVENNELQKVNFPNGWMDEDEFGNINVNKKGACSYTLDKGQRYDIQITKKGKDCFNSVPRAIQCNGITKKGNRCKRMTDNPSGLCNQHQR